MGRHRAQDQTVRREVRKELVKRQSVDCSLVDVAVMNGVAYLGGEVRPVRHSNVDIKEEMALIESIVRQVPGVRDVVNRVKLPFR